MAFRTPHNIGHQMDIELSLRPRVSHAIILYVAEHLSVWTSDFLSLSIKDGAVELRYGLGDGGLTVLTSRNKISHRGGKQNFTVLSVQPKIFYGRIGLIYDLVFQKPYLALTCMWNKMIF